MGLSAPISADAHNGGGKRASIRSHTGKAVPAETQGLDRGLLGGKASLVGS